MDEPTLTKVHEDARGAMYAISLPGDRELMLLFSKKGTLRGGHSHSVRETVMVLTGKMRYHKKATPYGPWPAPDPPPEVLFEGRVSGNDADQAHMGEFLEDTWLIEWKMAKKGEWRNENYGPWRERVDATTRS